MNGIAFGAEITTENTATARRIQQSKPGDDAEVNSVRRAGDFVSALLAGIEEFQAANADGAHSILRSRPAVASCAGHGVRDSAEVALAEEVQPDDHENSLSSLNFSPTTVFLITPDPPVGLGVWQGAEMDAKSMDADVPHLAGVPADPRWPDCSGVLAPVGSVATARHGTAVPDVMPNRTEIVHMARSLEVGFAGEGSAAKQEGPGSTRLGSTPSASQVGRSALHLDSSTNPAVKSGNRIALPLVMTGDLRLDVSRAEADVQAAPDSSDLATQSNDTAAGTSFLSSPPVGECQVQQGTGGLAGETAEPNRAQSSPGLQDEGRRPPSQSELQVTTSSAGGGQDENAEGERSTARDEKRFQGGEPDEQTSSKASEATHTGSLSSGPGDLPVSNFHSATRTSPNLIPVKRVDSTPNPTVKAGVSPTEAHRSPLQAVQIQIDGGLGTSVNLRFVEFGGDVRLSVRTQDTTLAAALNGSSQALQDRLHVQGWSSEFHPVAGSAPEPHARSGPGGHQIQSGDTHEPSEVPVARNAQMGMGGGSGESGQRHAASWAEQNEEMMNTAALRRLSRRGVL